MERVLVLIRLQLDSLHAGTDASGFRLLRNAVGYMHDYPGVVHHPAEDIMFRMLVSRTREAAPLCQLLSDQHREFHEQETQLLRDLDLAQQGDAGARKRLHGKGLEYCEEHAAHIRLEEAEVLPLAIAKLRAEDWQAVSDGTRALTDPVFGREASRQQSSIYEQLMSLSPKSGGIG
jgi:hemerythrin-like domain-containing protein